MADGNTNDSSNNVADGDNIANDGRPLRAVDPIVLMENGTVVDSSGFDAGAAKDGDFAAANINKRVVRVSVPYAVVTSLAL